MPRRRCPGGWLSIVSSRSDYGSRQDVFGRAAALSANFEISSGHDRRVRGIDDRFPAG